MAALSGNAWSAKGKAAGGADRGQAPVQPASASASASASAQADQHVPVKEFNAGEVKDFLKKSAFGSSCRFGRVKGPSCCFRPRSSC